ncbi:MAG: photosystem II S4 domain protein [Gloeomargaritaceae cyanobacterium C42_A2020_066]|nr:photosystem II S4 domain protein [Gloeomargaritaceae cyanobacterium C42_A2020_066]
MLARQDLLKGAEHPETLSRLLDRAEQALKTWQIAVSDFLTPPEWAEAEQRLGALAELQVVAWGGYPQAERQRVGLARPETPLTPADIPLALIEIRGNFLFDPAGHRDFLGAILGTGLVREKLGDILVLDERGAQAIVHPDLVAYLEQSLVQVRTVPVTTQGIPWDNLRVPPPRVRALQTVEASLRLDALASAGFGVSRSKMVDWIKQGDVRVNWQPVQQPSHPIKSGDLIAIRGRGRVAIGEIKTTQKGRFRVEMTRSS